MIQRQEEISWQKKEEGPGTGSREPGQERDYRGDQRKCRGNNLSVRKFRTVSGNRWNQMAVLRGSMEAIF